MRLVPLLLILFFATPLRAEDPKITWDKPLALMEVGKGKYGGPCFLDYRKPHLDLTQSHSQYDRNGIVSKYCLSKEFGGLWGGSINLATLHVSDPWFQKIDLDKDGKTEYLLRSGDSSTLLILYDYLGRNILEGGKVEHAENIRLIDKKTHVEIEVTEEKSAGFTEPSYWLISTYKKMGEKLHLINKKKTPIPDDVSPITKRFTPPKIDVAGHKALLKGYTLEWVKKAELEYQKGCFLEFSHMMEAKPDGEIVLQDMNGVVFHYCLEDGHVRNFTSVDVYRNIGPKFDKKDLDYDGVDEILLYGGSGRTMLLKVYIPVNGYHSRTPNFKPIDNKLIWSQNASIKLIDRKDFIEIRTMNSRLWMFSDMDKPFELIETFRKYKDKIIRTSSKEIPVKFEEETDK